MKCMLHHKQQFDKLRLTWSAAYNQAFASIFLACLINLQ